ncbi:MAG TPA: glycosyltransferase [Steroidobacteraceae bacterium]|nr:glycosyltransferase [Steroidobacteraceae bacterium]
MTGLPPDTQVLNARARSRVRELYISVRAKFAFSMAASLVWGAISCLLAARWIEDLTALAGHINALLIVGGIAIVPGFMNAFLVVSLLLDRRPTAAPVARYPGITILIAAYNEEDSILSTLQSIERQHYPGPLQAIVINDGSRDATATLLAGVSRPWLTVLNLARNAGKANALNRGFELAHHELVITLDGDSYLYRDALRNIVARFLCDPPDTAAVAGAMLVRNSRLNLVTKIQEWDYFHGIAAIKRIQSLYHGTLVAQGAFSLYRRDVLAQVGGWPECVGEDIVLTWAILRAGYRVGYCECACSFTNVPTHWRQFIRQRQRWSRGLIEAFKLHWPLLFKARMSTLFVWWNLLFPYLDIAFTVCFLPGLLLALFGIYVIAGPMTVLVLPLAMLVNYLMFVIQSRMFAAQGLEVRRNPLGFAVYALFYSVILQPACLLGYLTELVKQPKTWGTK